MRYIMSFCQGVGEVACTKCLKWSLRNSGASSILMDAY